jgi:DNA-directed RNA polymerase specialized sigma24 family protein
MKAFELLYGLYHPRLARFLLGMTRRPPLVEEILDDTMLVVWRKAHAYNPDARVSTWIFGIAYRQALKALRQVDDAVESGADSAGRCPPSRSRKASWRGMNCACAWMRPCAPCRRNSVPRSS